MAVNTTALTKKLYYLITWVPLKHLVNIFIFLYSLKKE